MHIERLLIDHCAPTLANIKAGSLFSIISPCWTELEEQVGILRDVLEKKGVSLRVIQVCEERALLYVYRKSKLGAILSDKKCERFLRKMGYQSFDIERAVDFLCERITSCAEFPHEIGLFLGYPLTDVVAFIENKGRGGICCGCWKCYSNECEARKTFAQYEKCTRVYRSVYRAGRPFSKLTVAA